MASSVDIVPSLGHGCVSTQAGVTLGYDAIDDRRAWTGMQRGEGVSTYNSFRVSQRGAGANMSVDVNMDDIAQVRGDSVALQGLYTIAPHSTTANVDIAAADASNPRIDLVVLEALDDTHAAGGLNKARVRVVTGTATVGATLDNRTGAPSTPDSAILLADVLVAAGATSIANASIRDRRSFSSGGLPTGAAPPSANIDCVPVIAPPAAVPLIKASFAPTDNRAVALSVFVPRRIVGATRIKWKYLQGATALTGAYAFSLYDATGTRIVTTGSVSYTGGASSQQPRSEPITATTFDVGWYWLVWGNDTTNAGTISVNAWSVDGRFVPYLGVAKDIGSSPISHPTWIAIFGDAHDNPSTIEQVVPMVSLSVG